MTPTQLPNDLIPAVLEFLYKKGKEKGQVPCQEGSLNQQGIFHSPPALTL